MLNAITTAVIRLEEKKVLKLVRYATNGGATQTQIINAIQNGLDQVGRLFESGEYGVTDLMMAGIIFEEVLKLDCLKMQTDSPSQSIGVILLCTIECDLHDIGKSIFKSAAQMAGFHVIDLGIDTPPARILKAIEQHHPQILAISSIMADGIKYIKETNDLLIASGLRDTIKIILGGLSTHRDAVAYTGVDAFTQDVYEGVNLCKKWIGGGHDQL